MNEETRKYDVVVWGATGFTGRLVAGYLLERYGTGGDLRWAMGGRNEAKLAEVREQLGPGWEEIPILLGDSNDPASLDEITTRTRVICSTVGPFAKYGSELVAACARNGTHYCDITGEVQWVRRMIEAHEAQARESGARIVNFCGFDSIPSDLGCFFVNQAMQERHGVPCSEVKLRVRRMKGTFSGGTFASMMVALDEGRGDREVRRILGNPYALNPEGERRGPDGSDQQGPAWDGDADSWTAPFVMASVNTRVVRRSNALMDYAYGRDFRYSESMMTGQGIAGMARAASITGALGGLFAGLSFSPTRALLTRFMLPAPGEGPTEEQREQGFFDMLVIGKHPTDASATIRARVKGDRDPGYGATCKMLGECAVCLALDGDELGVGGGFWTPASGMGEHLIRRLTANAGMSFELV